MAVLSPKSVYAPGRKPPKAEIIQLLDQIIGASGGPSVVRQTAAALDLVTPAAETYGGVVLNDPDPTKNGYYYRSSAVWVKGRGFPDTFAELTGLGGSANAVTASSAPGVVPGDVEVFYIVPLADNTGPVTLSINGGSAKSVKNVSGADLSAGLWTSGRRLMLVDAGTSYGLLSDPDADAAAASAAASAATANEEADRSEDEADRAEAARDAAIAAASAAQGIQPPQGRLTLASSVPVMVSDYLAATSIYYTPFIGGAVPVWNGTAFEMRPFTELVLALDSNSGHTQYHQTGKNFDLFVINDGGTMRLATGPAWSTDNARGTGAGTTEYERKAGILTNKQAITVRFGSGASDTVGLAANRGTLVGSVRTTANGQTEFSIAPAAASGGTNNKLFLSNAYNQRAVLAKCREDAASWFYTALTSLGNANASANNRISFLNCLPECPVVAELWSVLAIGNAATVYGQIAIGLDSSTVSAGLRTFLGASANLNSPIPAEYSGVPGLGLHYVQALTGSLGTGWGGAGYRVDFTGKDTYSFTCGLQM